MAGLDKIRDYERIRNELLATRVVLIVARLEFHDTKIRGSFKRARFFQSNRVVPCFFFSPRDEAMTMSAFTKFYQRIHPERLEIDSIRSEKNWIDKNHI